MARTQGTARSPLQLELPATPESVTHARHEAGIYAASHGGDREGIEAFVSEAVANAVVHAFRGRPPGSVSVELKPNGNGDLLVSVADNGIGIRPDPDRKGLGFGLALMAALAKSVSIERPTAGGTRIQARFAPIS